MSTLVGRCVETFLFKKVYSYRLSSIKLKSEDDYVGLSGTFSALNDYE